MNKFKQLSLIVVIFFMLQLSVRVLALCLSKPVSLNISNYNMKEARVATPAYGWEIGKDKLPHAKVFFWVSKNAKKYYPYTNEAIKTYVISHGTINQWGVKETGKTNETEKLIYLYVPKTFILIYGSKFYTLVGVAYE